MPPKKATAATTKKASAPADHPPYKDMIKEAILQLKERNGSSRQAIKKYVLNNNKGIKESNFDTQFNAAIKRGVNSGDFIQPKGPSGPVKLQKKEAAKPAAKVAKATSEKPVKKVAPKKAAPAAAPKKAAAKPTKAKAATTTTTTAPKAKSTTANSKKPRKTTAATEKASLNKTKTGRVSKAAKPAAPTTKKAAAPKKTASKKKATEAAAPPASAD